MIFTDALPSLRHPAAKLSQTGNVYRWNPHYELWEFWSVGEGMWRFSLDYKGANEGISPLSHGNAVITYDATWAEPVRVEP